MKKISLFVLFFQLSMMLYAQISFPGFTEEQCGLITDHGFTYENIDMMCGSHSSGYKIYHYGELIYEDCINFGGCSVKDLLFISPEIGFIVESNTKYGHRVLKTEDTGNSWTEIGSGAPNYLGVYLINENTAFMLTSYENDLYLVRLSDIRKQYLLMGMPPENNTSIQDTVFGEPMCPIDALHFKIQQADDIFNYTINFVVEPLSTDEILDYSKALIVPNPAQDYIHIRTTDRETNAKSIRIFTQLGKLVQTMELAPYDRIFIGDLKPGIYFLEIQHAGRKEVLKFLKI